jgi:hypothetical protein
MSSRPVLKRKHKTSTHEKGPSLKQGGIDEACSCEKKAERKVQWTRGDPTKKGQQQLTLLEPLKL